jgi:hypothetical protein
MVTAALVLSSGLGACGNNTHRLVTTRRQMTQTEAAAILDGRVKQVLHCGNPDQLGSSTWDYGAIGTDEPRGRKPDDALQDAIASLTKTASIHAGSGARTSPVPKTRWVELRGPNPSAVVFVHLGGPTNYLIQVNGDPQRGIWRHSGALNCRAAR